LADLDGYGWAEASADPPPECRGSMFIRQRLADYGSAQQLFGVYPST
jgi:hypothetical protein